MMFLTNEARKSHIEQIRILRERLAETSMTHGLSYLDSCDIAKYLSILEHEIEKEITD